MQCEELSNVSKIIENPLNPMDLFKSFRDHYEKHSGMIGCFMNIATVDENGTPSNRTVVLRRYDDEAIYFVTQRDTKKYSHLLNNPKIAVVFLWQYLDNQGIINRQIRINGIANEMDEISIKQFYDEETVMSKIRSKICECNKPIEWEVLKEKHDAVLMNYKNGTDDLPMNNLYTAFKITMDNIDFYESRCNEIGDRLFYTRGNGSWTSQRVQA